MSRFGNLFKSSIGRKILMAGTGAVLIAFAIVHLAGNLLVFRESEAINGYAHFLHSLGPTLWIVRLLLLASLGIHVWAAAVLALENRRARGLQPAKTTWIQATLQSRTMKLTGAVVLAFIVYHLAQFTFGFAQTDSFRANIPAYTMKADFHLLGLLAVKAGEMVPDVRAMIIQGFQSPYVSTFYVLAIGLLSLHMLHGIESTFQTFGLSTTSMRSRNRVVVKTFCLLYFLGSILIPFAALGGYLTSATIGGS